MTATVQSAQDTGALRIITGPLTVPLEIIRAAGARHRVAVQQHDALPGWALLAVAAFAAGLVLFAIVAWRDLASPLLIACSLIGAVAAFAPDLLPVRVAQPDPADA